MSFEMNMREEKSTEWEEFLSVEDQVYFRKDLYLYSPESFTPEQGLAIVKAMQRSTKAIDEALREDFASRLLELQEALIESLTGKAGRSKEEWRELLGASASSAA